MSIFFEASLRRREREAADDLKELEKEILGKMGV